MYALFIPTEKEALSIFGSADFFYENGIKSFYWKGHTIRIAGFGKVNAAVTLTRYIAVGGEGMPLLAGIAGAYRQSGLNVGDIAFISEDHFVDEALYDGSSLKGTHEMGFPICDDNKLTFHVPEAVLPVCSANTVSLLTGTAELATLYHQKTSAAMESMEGAAFALAAKHMGRSAVQLRAVSNYCGRREDACWNANSACSALYKALDSFL